MALFSKALRSELSHYRRRKTISLDGTVGGMDHPSRRGQYVTPADGMLGAGGAPSHHSVYDAHAQYHWPSRQYVPPEPWFEGTEIHKTPPLRMGPPQQRALRFPEADEGHDDQGQFLGSPAVPVVEEFGEDPVQQRMVKELRVRQLDRELAALDQDVAGDSETVRRDEPAEGDPFAGHPWYGPSAMTQELFEEAMQDAFPEAAEESVPQPAVTHEEMEAYRDQQEALLEDIVNQAMPPAEEMLEEEDPWERYQKEMMDPGMMGFGPMPGP